MSNVEQHPTRVTRLVDRPEHGWRFNPAPPMSSGPRIPIGLIIAPVVALVVLVLVFFTVLRPRLGWPAYGPDPGDGTDPLLPSVGAAGYDAQNYHVEVTWLEDREQVSGTTTMTAVADQDLGSLHLDLAPIAREVLLDGRKVRFVQEGTDLRVIGDKFVAKGQKFDVTVRYSGLPDGADEVEKSVLWKKNREWVFASEPLGALFWFPSNGHPSDPATMDVVAHVPRGLQAISAGRLVARDLGKDPNQDTWSWRVDQAVPTYANFLAIGDFTITENTADGRPFVGAVSKQLDPLLADGVTKALGRTPEMVKTLEQIWGPYPSRDLGGVAPAVAFSFGGIETEGRPVYDSHLLAQNPDRLLSHELSHMWFGNKVTMRTWADLYMNEAYASYTEWVVSERTDQFSANQRMQDAYQRIPDNQWAGAISDPPARQVSMAPYVRGPLAMQALRNLMGDEAFFALGRDWAAQSGPKGLQDWRAMARQHTPVNLDHYFEVWIDGDKKPAATAENGFR